MSAKVTLHHRNSMTAHTFPVKDGRAFYGSLLECMEHGGLMGHSFPGGSLTLGAAYLADCLVAILYEDENDDETD